MAKKHSTQKESYWFNHIQAQKKSGLTHKQYCFEQGISDYTFRYWKSKFKNKSSESPKNSKFISLKPNSSDSLKITLPEGMELDFPELPDPHWMASFIKRVGGDNALA